MIHRLNPLWAIVPNTPLQVILLSVCFLSTPVSSLPTQNMTIEVPQGTTNHGDPTLLCIPPTSIDILKFFLLNYFAHALTVVSYPGESTVDVIMTMIAAVLFPTSGAMRGIGSILRGVGFILRYFPCQSTDLQKAAQCGALYMVVRSRRWKPQKVRIEDVPRVEVVLGEDVVSREDNKDAVCEKGVQAVGEDGVTWDGVVRDIWVSETEPAESARRTSTKITRELMPSTGELMPSTGEMIRKIVGYSESTAPPTIGDQVETPTSLHAVISTYVPSWMGDSSELWSHPETCNDPRFRDRFGPNKQQLPDEYDFAFVPQNAIVEEFEPSTPIKLSYSYSWVKGAAALLQALYAIFTLYNSRGNQIDQYGYAAFGLTVVPYVVMSVLNLFAHLVTPSYSTLYLVESEVMKEAEQRRKGLRFRNVVGRLKSFTGSENGLDTQVVPHQDHPDDTSSELSTRRDSCNTVGYLTNNGVLRLPSVSSRVTEQNEDLQVTTMMPGPGRHLYVQIPACPRFHRKDSVRVPVHEPIPLLDEGMGLLDLLFFLVVCGIEIGIIGGLSGFRKGGSTRAQRVWTMTWFVFGCSMGFSVYISRRPVKDSDSDSAKSKRLSDILGLTILFVLYSAPAIGGFIVVGQMLKAYGSCLTLN